MPLTKDSQEIAPRVVPFNIQAEQMLLGAILINSDLLSSVNEFLMPEHFFDPLHKKIYHAINVMTEKGLIANTITIRSMLDKERVFIDNKGEEYIIRLTAMAMIIINPSDYGRIIYDLAMKRSLIAIGQEIVNDAYNSTLEDSAESQLELAESKLYTLSSDGLKDKSFVPMKDSVFESLSRINKAMKNSNHVTGISTGLIDLDTKLSGFHNADLVIIAGRPSMGKTAFAINFAFNACKSLTEKSTEGEDKKSVAFFSLEMSSEQLATRLLSRMTEIDSSCLRSGRIREEQYNSLRKAAGALSDMPFFIDDTPALSISAIRNRARKLKRQHNLGIIFIDYLQLIKASIHKENRVLEISEITQGLKAIAKELNVPVIALSQLSRAVEQRDDKRPLLSDLRESGTIEQDADVVMFLYREEYYLSRKEPPQDSTKYAEWMQNLNKAHDVAEVIIAKHRNGAVGNVQLYYADKYSIIGNLHKSSIIQS